MKLRNKKKAIRDIGQSIDLQKCTVWNVIKNKEDTAELSNHNGTGRKEEFYS